MWLPETEGHRKLDGSKLSRKVWAVEAQAVTGALWRSGRKTWERIALTSPQAGESPVGLALWCGDRSFKNFFGSVWLSYIWPPSVVLRWSFKPRVNGIHLHHSLWRYPYYLGVSHSQIHVACLFIYFRKSLSQKSQEKPGIVHITLIALWIIKQSFFFF